MVILFSTDFVGNKLLKPFQGQRVIIKNEWFVFLKPSIILLKIVSAPPLVWGLYIDVIKQSFLILVSGVISTQCCFFIKALKH
jgi:hypothetical protein